MGLIDTAMTAALATAKKGPDCKLKVLSESLPKKDRAELDEWLNDIAIPHTVIHRALQAIYESKVAAGDQDAHLWDLSRSAVERHRRTSGDKCQCPRTAPS